jgi:hypothetical protein
MQESAFDKTNVPVHRCNAMENGVAEWRPKLGTLITEWLAFKCLRVMWGCGTKVGHTFGSYVLALHHLRRHSGL